MRCAKAGARQLELHDLKGGDLVEPAADDGAMALCVDVAGSLKQARAACRSAGVDPRRLHVWLLPDSVLGKSASRRLHKRCDCNGDHRPSRARHAVLGSQIESVTVAAVRTGAGEKGRARNYEERPAGRSPHRCAARDKPMRSPSFMRPPCDRVTPGRIHSTLATLLLGIIRPPADIEGGIAYDELGFDAERREGFC